jgi:hypothetical protein
MTVRRAMLMFIPLAVVITALCSLAYLIGQQSQRTGANDPQVQMAEDAAARLDAGETPAAAVRTGPPVDVARSLAPFVVVYDATGTPLATDGELDGAAPSVPKGVLDTARARGVDAVTWQPRAGVRIATVTVPWQGGTVTAGRSLRLVEERVDDLTRLVGLAWIVTLAATLVVCVAVSFLWNDTRARGDDVRQG